MKSRKFWAKAPGNWNNPLVPGLVASLASDIEVSPFAFSLRTNPPARYSGGLSRPKKCGRNHAMYLIAIGWLYVALLVAISDTTVVGGVLRSEEHTSELQS